MEGEGQEPTGSIRPTDLADPKDKLVLLVDDDESILELLEHVVKKEGFRVERAADGEEGLRKIREIEPDIIVLDFMLPGMGGFEVLKELQGEKGGDIPVLVITGRRIDAQTADMIRRESNVKDYMEKPIRPVRLLAMLHKTLNTRPPEAKPGLGGGGFGKRGAW